MREHEQVTVVEARSGGFVAGVAADDLAIEPEHVSQDLAAFQATILTLEPSRTLHISRMTIAPGLSKRASTLKIRRRSSS